MVRRMKTTTKKILCTLCLAVLAWVAVTSSSYADPISDAAPQNLGLSGTTAFDGWNNFSSTTLSGFGGFPGTSAWTGSYGTTVSGAIGSYVAGSGDAILTKAANGTSGGPYVASGSIYSGGFSGDANVNGGTLAVTDTTPLADLKTIVFQLEIGEAWTYDLYNHALPTLTYTYNDGTGDVTVTSVAADYSSILLQAYNGTVTMPSGEEPVYINLHALQWDLSAVTGDITAFTINFTTVQHSQVYAMQLDQGDTMVQVVPEPSTYAMIVAGSALLLWRLRRREALAV